MHYKEVIHYKFFLSMYCMLFKLIKISFFKKNSQNKLLFSFSLIKFDTVASYMNNCLQFYESHSNGHSFTTGLTSVPSPTCSFARALVHRLLGIPLLLVREASFLVPSPEKRPVPPRQLVGLDAPDAISSVHRDLEATLEAIDAKNGELILEYGAISSVD